MEPLLERGLLAVNNRWRLESKEAVFLTVVGFSDIVTRKLKTPKLLDLFSSPPYLDYRLSAVLIKKAPNLKQI